ncbi:acyl-CoA carboxylase subunit epsilon [Arenivirga flava]|uniref:Acyl-CoA carboxylase subunit epsilon n=1 Tax=Arenivirga flava TaxID=1930060 RepID=A0AA37X8Z6_9MICO|nr:acyl-CoA carboxylase subunit epsilon [Arenivirga flava]GMA28034.1 hypothetical protein GCM10025874_12870 [Arenivirga flava]
MSLDQGSPLDLRFVAGSPSDEEVAAVAAVLTAAIEELAARGGEVSGPRRPGTSAWSRSQRPLRTPLQPGPGRWAHEGR